MRALRPIVALTVSMSLLGAMPASGQTNRPQPSRPAATTATATSPIHLAYFWGHLESGTIGQVAANSDTFVLHQGALDVKQQLQAAGARGKYLQYIRAEAIMDSNGVTPWKNQVAFKPGDWADISTNHPDWFLLDSRGRRISPDPADPNEAHFWLMDPANPGWRAFFAERIRQMQSAGGWDGLWLDNIELSLGKRQRAGQTLARYTTDAAYTTAVNDFVSYLKRTVQQPSGKQMGANLISERRPGDGSWTRAMANLTGGMSEAWAVGWNTGARPDAGQWSEDLTQAQQSLRSGRSLMLVSQGDAGDRARMRLAYASYLLIANGRTSFRYADYRHYGQAWTYPEYALKVGQPVGSRRKVGNAWVRDFTNGRVSVDPTTWAVSITAR